MAKQSPKELITQLAMEQGFDAVGFAAPHLKEEAREGLRAFLLQGHHGTMEWLADRRELREHPEVMLPEVRTIIVLGMNYAPAENPLAHLGKKRHGTISVYAQNRDYHDVLKGRLKQLASKLTAKLGGGVKVFVDTAPVMEKPLAAATQLGWQGKHTCVVSPEYGSWLFLGELFTTLEIPPDAPHAYQCGSCSRCIAICPTQAIIAPHQLDARRCISYLTIEHKGHIPLEFRAAIGNRIYGCDDCLAVCPWNKFAQTASESAFIPRPELQSPLLAELAALDDAGFRALFSASPAKRIGHDRFVRNVMIAIGNSGDTAMLPVIQARLEDASPLVRAMAVWALWRLLPPEAFAENRACRLPGESDEAVRNEWLLDNEPCYTIS